MNELSLIISKNKNAEELILFKLSGVPRYSYFLIKNGMRKFIGGSNNKAKAEEEYSVYASANGFIVFSHHLSCSK